MSYKRLSIEKVIEIYNAVKLGESRTSVAKRFGVSIATVSKTCIGDVWQSAGLEPLPKKSRFITEGDAWNIYLKAKSGVSLKEIANEFHVDIAAIDSLITGETYSYYNIPKMERPWRKTLKGLPIEERFRNRITIRTDIDCHDWNGSVDSSGYGQLRVNGMTRKAHRIAYSIAYGEIPNGMFVCHKCDRPICCNPEHLFLGSNLDNMRDMDSKGRRALGEVNGKSKLKADTVILIANEIKMNKGSAEIARNLGLPVHLIYQIRNGLTWTHLTGFSRKTKNQNNPCTPPTTQPSKKSSLVTSAASQA